jgi:3-hydroxybutyrate dehydrogenase
MGMNKKTVLITGSTAGIGLGLATSFAEKGYNIIFNGLESGAGEVAAAIASRYQENYIFSAANMSDPSALRELVVRSVSEFGTIDVLVNNAGIQYVCPIEDFPEIKWDEIIAVNLTAPFHLIKACWPYMKKNNYGRIINIASAHGLVASEYKSAYVAAKHGLIGLTKTAALEGAPFNITCNAICPGYVKTNLVEKQIKDQATLHDMPEQKVTEKFFLSKQAVKEFIPIQSIADLTLLLASSSSTTITGGVYPIDGGWTAQ